MDEGQPVRLTVQESFAGSSGLYVLIDQSADVEFPEYRLRVAITRPDGSRAVLKANVGVMTFRRGFDERVALFFPGMMELDVPVGTLIEVIGDGEELKRDAPCFPVILQWLSPEVGGYDVPKATGRFVAPVSFDLPYAHGEMWSLVLDDFGSAANGNVMTATVRFLAPEAPHDVLYPGAQFRVMDGSKRIVAVGRVLPKVE